MTSLAMTAIEGYRHSLPAPQSPDSSLEFVSSHSIKSHISVRNTRSWPKIPMMRDIAQWTTCRPSLGFCAASEAAFRVNADPRIRHARLTKGMRQQALADLVALECPSPREPKWTPIQTMSSSSRIRST
jgi:hypothetical protein